MQTTRHDWLRAITTAWILLGVIPAMLSAQSPQLTWRAMPPLPDELGLAGPVVGIHNDVLIAGGGANFARPVWDNAKQWHSQIYALDLRSPTATWQKVGDLPSQCAYSACASTPWGVAILGGNDDRHELSGSWLLQATRGNNGQIDLRYESLPALPKPNVYGQAVLAGDCLIVLTGQIGSALSTAIAGGWSLSFKKPSADSTVPTVGQWQPIADCPGGPRAFAMACTTSSDRNAAKLLLVGGRRDRAGTVEFLSDTWLYDRRTDAWQQLADLPVPVTAGGIGLMRGGQIAVVSGDDGKLFTQTEQLKDQHPGFAKRTWLFDLKSNRWQAGNASPANQVTSTPVAYREQLILVSGEVRPRVRTNQVWEIDLVGK